LAALRFFPAGNRAESPRPDHHPGKAGLKVEILADADAAARQAAAAIAAAARSAVDARGRFVMAISGGRTPRSMLRALVTEDVPWRCVHVLQVDERIAPAGSAQRNLAVLAECLLGRTDLPPAQLHPMPVESVDFDAAATEYAQILVRLAGSPPTLDLVHLGLGIDGHTASLFAEDSVLAVEDRSVAVTDSHAGWRRMTLTYPVLDRARTIVWLVTGAEKAPVVRRLLAHDRSIPASRIGAERAVIFLDGPAVGRQS
jgi:6-phosphogluconolactonase